MWWINLKNSYYHLNKNKSNLLIILQINLDYFQFQTKIRNKYWIENVHLLVICFNLIFTNLGKCLIKIKLTQIHINIVCLILLKCLNQNLKNNLLISLVWIYNVQSVITFIKSIPKMGFNINHQTNYQQNNNCWLAEVIRI